MLFRSAQAVDQIAASAEPVLPEVRYLIDFLRQTFAGRQGRAREALRKK